VFARLFALVIGVLGGVAFSQLPEFSQQYRQRIGGAIDELAGIVARFEADARASGLTREQAVERLKGSGEAIARRQGDSAAATIRRLHTLDRQRADMQTAGAFRRVASLSTAGDTELMRATWKDFEPAVPVTFEGLAFALAGFLAGWLAIDLSAAGLRRWRRRRLRPAPARS
jgi:hypothetical protein